MSVQEEQAQYMQCKYGHGYVITYIAVGIFGVLYKDFKDMETAYLSGNRSSLRDHHKSFKDEHRASQRQSLAIFTGRLLMLIILQIVMSPYEVMSKTHSLSTEDLGSVRQREYVYILIMMADGIIPTCPNLVTATRASFLTPIISNQRESGGGRTQEAHAISCPKIADLRTQNFTEPCPNVADLRQFEPDAWMQAADLRVLGHGWGQYYPSRNLLNQRRRQVEKETKCKYIIYHNYVHL